MSGERDPPEGIAIETPSPDDRLDVLRVLDAAMLETTPEAVDAAIGADDALVARFERTDAVVGALVATRPKPERLHVDAVAVRRARRGRGIGSALVAAAVRRAERDPEVAAVTAEFDPKLEGFYRDLGFDAMSATGSDESDRLRGRRRVDEG
ncbi:GNAT family N-acetyltransferase [Halorubrum amylolyticum]|uniref:GNAT family N-acetyltransferase n=1 Tax=Halorubrum amylolyticum TaxID=2508724 RepID=UPI001008FBB1|nr:GNAT family N-acetyltransferase [Halorubrum amylolyticum]